MMHDLGADLPKDDNFGHVRMSKYLLRNNPKAFLPMSTFNREDWTDACDKLDEIDDEEW